MRHTLKRFIERAAVLSGVPLVTRMVSSPRALVLMYHNVVPNPDPVAGDRSLHLSHREFARQLDYLQAVCEIVPLQTLIDGPFGDGARFHVAITFDDAYVGAVSLGVEELLRRHLPATIFVPPALLGQEMWWDVLSAESPGGMSSEARSKLLQEFQGRGEAIRRSPQWAAGRCATPLLPELRISNETELATAASRPGITIGSHTWTHPNLAAIDSETLDAELERSLQWLRERFSSFLPYITYPYGLSSPRVEQAAARAGYRAAFLAHGGWFPDDVAARRYALPRFDVSAGISLDGFRLRLAGYGLTRV